MKDKLTRKELEEMAKTEKSLSDIAFDNLTIGMVFNYYVFISGIAYMQQSQIRVGHRTDKYIVFEYISDGLLLAAYSKKEFEQNKDQFWYYFLVEGT